MTTTSLPDSLEDDIRSHLHWCMAENPGSRWVMSRTWWNDVRNAVIDIYGWRLWSPSRSRIDLLYGLPIDVRPDGGPPHMETP